MKIYKPQIVAQLDKFYGDSLYNIEQFNSIGHHLEVLAQMLWEGINSDNKFLYFEINNYHPSFLGWSIDQIINKGISFSDCQMTIASEHGFRNWQEVEKMKLIVYHFEFESAVNSLLDGNLDALNKQLQIYPDIINQRSQYGHKATLLHYCASNGVEMWRQKVPENLCEICKFLVKNGADPSTTMKVYGGNFTPIQLLKTSSHPYNAGLGKELEEILDIK